MKTIILSLFFITTIVTVSMADGKSLYKNCTGCHGETGELSALQKSELISGQSQEQTIKQLTAYKNGELNQYGLGNIMNLQLMALSQSDLEELSIYISNFK